MTNTRRVRIPNWNDGSRGNGPYVPLLSPSISIGRRSFVTATNQWVREGKTWKRGRSVVGMGFRRSYVPQKFEARWVARQQSGQVSTSLDVGVWGGGGEVARLWCARGRECFSAQWRSEPAQGQRLAWATGALGLRYGAGRLIRRCARFETTTGTSCRSVRRRNGRRKVSPDFEAF